MKKRIGGEPFLENKAVQKIKDIDSGEWRAVPAKKIPMAERLENISRKLKARHATTVIELDLMEAYQLGQYEIVRLKAERDSFAIGLIKWMANEVTLGDNEFYVHTVAGKYKVFTAELIDLYKETLKT